MDEMLGILGHGIRRMGIRGVNILWIWELRRWDEVLWRLATWWRPRMRSELRQWLGSVAWRGERISWAVTSGGEPRGRQRKRVVIRCVSCGIVCIIIIEVTGEA